MNAAELTFGIEIETTVPTGALAIGGHGCGLAIPQLPGWKADRDPSIIAHGNRDACEFVSPILRGVEGLAQLLADLATIKSLGAAVNSSCGLHIHVGFDKSNRAAMEKLSHVVANFEKAIYASTGTKNRERGRWCNSIQQYQTADNALQRTQGSRYHVCNMRSSQPTVEFRAFSASLNPVKIQGYIGLCLALVEKSLKTKRAPKWKAKITADTSPIHRAGEGQTALTRFFYTMGWTRGRTDYTFGNILGAALPKAKRALMQLARKYDAQT